MTIINKQKLARIVENTYNEPSNIDDFEYIKGDPSGKVRLYKNNRNQVVITHRGTKLTDVRDLLSDISLGISNYENDKQFQERREITKQFISEVKKSGIYSPSITIAGHSLGGTSAIFCVDSDDYISNNTSQVVVFNPGKSIIGNKLMSNLKPSTQSKLHEYHYEGDPISKGQHSKQTSYVKHNKSVFDKVVHPGNKANSVYQGLKTFYTHSIKRFF